MNEVARELDSRLKAALGMPSADRQAEVLRVFVAALARAFDLQADEVAIFMLCHDGAMLRFVFPTALGAGGRNAFPLTVASVAGRVAQTGTGFYENDMRQVPHLAFYERARTQDKEPLPIQKLLVAPLRDGEGGVRGVVEVSRRARTMSEAGPDFGPPELSALEALLALAAPAVLAVCSSSGESSPAPQA